MTDSMHSAHWGAFRARRDGDSLTITPFSADPDPARCWRICTTRLRIRRAWRAR